MGYRITTTETRTTERTRHIRSDSDAARDVWEECLPFEETHAYGDVTITTRTEMCPHDCGYSEAIRGDGDGTGRGFSPVTFRRYVCDDCGDVTGHSIDHWSYATGNFRTTADGMIPVEVTAYVAIDGENAYISSHPRMAHL